MSVQTFDVVFAPAGVRGQFAAGTPVLEAARQLGVGIESICGGTGACAKCRCQVLEGVFDPTTGEHAAEGVLSKASNISAAGVSEAKLLKKNQFKDGERLSCQAKVEGDIVVFIPEEARVRDAVVRKAAGKPIAIRDAVTRKYCVNVPAPTLEDHRGDWERLNQALKAEHNIDTTIDFTCLKQLSDIAKPLRAKPMQITATVWRPRLDAPGEVVRVEIGDTTAVWLGLAVDLGTTTMASYLCDMHTGETLATESQMNPQISIGGDDVMNRIAASDNPEKLDRMQRAVTETLAELCDKATQSVGYTAQDICEIVLVANTCMHHIFLGLDPDSLGKSPFNPRVSQSVDVKARDLQLAHVLPSINVHLLANQAGFVGGDSTSVAIALEPYNSEKLVAIVDIGTNGEILVGNKDKIYSTSCPTGPALEGASIKFGVRAARGAIEKVRIDPKTFDVRFKVIGKEAWNTRLEPETIGAIGLCGSAIIESVAELFKSGILAANGKFNMEYEAKTNRLRRGEDGDPEFVIAWANETSLGRDIAFTIDDVRAVQLAKAAVYSGIQVLLDKLGRERPEQVILAGAFGSHLDLRRSLMTGLFQDVGFENMKSVGNAAGDGARMALMNRTKREEAEQIARKIHYVELTNESSFVPHFVNATLVPHKTHRFASLARYGISPEPPVETKKRRRERTAV